MPRPKTASVNLPPNVQRVRAGKKTYFYYQPLRGTAKAGKRIALGSDPSSHDFWMRLRAAQGAEPLAEQEDAGTWAKLISEYRASQEFAYLKPRTQGDYASYLDRLLQSAGDRLVEDLTRADVYQLRDSMAKTPVAANHMVSVLRTLLEWSVPRGYRADNPAAGIKKLKNDQEGAAPWPEDGYAFVLAHAPDDLRRMAFLGRACGQRREDLVTMRGCDLKQDGIWVTIQKLRDKRHFVPLLASQVAEIASWGVKDLDYFLKSPTGKPYSPDGLNSRWGRWRKAPDAAPVTDATMTIHGLRATAVCDRREAGATDGGIADELCMSVAMVSRYARFADKQRSARASRDRREKKA